MGDSERDFRKPDPESRPPTAGRSASSAIGRQNARKSAERTRRRSNSALLLVHAWIQRRPGGPKAAIRYRAKATVARFPPPERGGQLAVRARFHSEHGRRYRMKVASGRPPAPVKTRPPHERQNRIPASSGRSEASAPRPGCLSAGNHGPALIHPSIQTLPGSDPRWMQSLRQDSAWFDGRQEEALEHQFFVGFLAEGRGQSWPDLLNQGQGVLVVVFAQ